MTFGEKMTKPRVVNLIDCIVSLLAPKLLCKKWDVVYILKMYQNLGSQSFNEDSDFRGN